MQDFRYFPLDQDLILKVFRDEQLRLFWVGRDFPFCNSGQYLARRTQRWQEFLKKSGWPREALEGVFGVTHEALRRRKVEEAPEGVVTETEQLLRSSAMIGLLSQAASCQAAGASDLAARASNFLGKLFSEASGEVHLQGSITVACPLLNGFLDLRALAAATAAVPCRTLRKFHNSLQNQDSVELKVFLDKAASHKLLHSCCLSCGQLLDAWLAQRWETLSQDPLAAKVVPSKSKRTAQRLDPTLRRALAEVAGTGRQNLILARRLGAARALEHVKKLPTATRLSEESIAALFSQRKFLTSQQAAAPQISIAMDASRVGGEKTLALFMIHLQQSWHLWLPVQAVRDFAPQEEHQLCSPGDALQARWSLGLQNFFRDFTEHACNETSGELGPAAKAAENKTKKGQENLPGQDRMSSHDLLVCLDNALRSLGLSLASFTPKPAAVTSGKAAAEPELPSDTGRAPETEAPPDGAGSPEEVEEPLVAAAAEDTAQAAEAAEPLAQAVEAAEPSAEDPQNEAAEPLLVLSLDQASWPFFL